MGASQLRSRLLHPVSFRPVLNVAVAAGTLLGLIVLTPLPSAMAAMRRESLAVSPSATVLRALPAATPSPGDELGISVAISGSVGVSGADNANAHAGEAYVFTRSGSSWRQQTVIPDPDGTAYDSFGYAVAVSNSSIGNLLVISAPGADNGTGEVDIFQPSGSTWTQIATLSDPDPAPTGGNFGQSVAIYNTTVIVGADEDDNQAGAAYVFAYSGGTWGLQASLSNPQPSIGEFGYAVGMYNTHLVVGSAGEAFVYVISGSAWNEQTVLTCGCSGNGPNFGTAISMAHAGVVVGASGVNNGQGVAYIFTVSGSKWQKSAMLSDPGKANGDKFGSSVSVSASTIVVGAPYTTKQCGEAYVYTGSGASWTEKQFETVKCTGIQLFGWSVEVSSTTALFGAPSVNSQAGEVYVLVVP